MLDIDDTEDRAYGQQQLSLFNTHHDNRCFMPIRICEATTGKPVAVFLRPGKTPDGIEVAMVVLRQAPGRDGLQPLPASWRHADNALEGSHHVALVGEAAGESGIGQG